MILVDSALKRREEAGQPIRVGIVGAGAMGRAIAYQIERCTPGMTVVAIANRSLNSAERSFLDAGRTGSRHVTTPQGLAAALADGLPAITTDPMLLCRAEGIDVIHEVTGTVEHATHVILEAIANGKTVVTMNAEVQGTIGPVLKARADAAGVLLTDSDGDQPGVMMNLYRFVQGLGIRPVVLGNMKGLHDAYRNPTTQADFSRRTGLTPHMAASFADGTKMSFEMALVANATGLRAGRRGLYGPDCAHVTQAVGHYPPEQMIRHGIVDYIVGAEPAPGVFCIGHEERPMQTHWLKLYKLGEGPFYTFYTPYHLCHLEAPTTIARAALFGDATCAPEAGHIVDVVATAKTDLRAGDTLDGIGWYMTYGQCENADISVAEGLLPMGLAEGCRLKRDVPKDRVLTYDDVDLPEDRLADRLRAEQVAWD
ncbi:NAD(P)-dependent oxidoreductase [Halovulum dunhuangense]|uniref:NAD(P)-dependent oxidoreductase n=1 Tax=Halovulum dunhuangense TaxID=1505036 RepID=A0A849L1X7_9RHOB|nr:SAF domain-containing protein [Halovulum dunhuangense]NNU80306.1 NAD(P)-dependent oxidoreductase [Halovulum dunhuangense]